jgi:hypothetical protein
VAILLQPKSVDGAASSSVPTDDVELRDMRRITTAQVHNNSGSTQSTVPPPPPEQSAASVGAPPSTGGKAKIPKSSGSASTAPAAEKSSGSGSGGAASMQTLHCELQQKVAAMALLKAVNEKFPVPDPDPDSINPAGNSEDPDWKD